MATPEGSCPALKSTTLFYIRLSLVIATHVAINLLIAFCFYFLPSF